MEIGFVRYVNRVVFVIYIYTIFVLLFFCVICWRRILMPSTPSPHPRPERAVIGFFLYVTSIFAFVIYVLWAYLPNDWFDQTGITYYPHKYWSIAMAVFVLILLVGIVLGTCLVNSLSVPSLDSTTLIHDRHARKSGHFERSDTDAIAPVSDLDLSFVNRVLYSK